MRLRTANRALWRLIFGLGILHVGERITRASRSFPNLDAIMKASVEELQRIPDVGEVVGGAFTISFANLETSK